MAGEKAPSVNPIENAKSYGSTVFDWYSDKVRQAEQLAEERKLQEQDLARLRAAGQEPVPAGPPKPAAETVVPGSTEGRSEEQGGADVASGLEANMAQRDAVMNRPSKYRSPMGTAGGPGRAPIDRGIEGAGLTDLEASRDAEARGVEAVRQYQDVQAEIAEKTGAAYATRQADADRAYARYLQDQEEERKTLEQKRLDLEAKTDAYTKDLADKGKFWKNPGNIIWAIANVFVSKGNSGQSADALLQQRIQQDFAERKALADSHLGALKSNLEGYRQIMGDKKAGDLMALGYAFKMAGQDAQRIAMQMGGAENRAKGEVLASSMESLAARTFAESYLARVKEPAKDPARNPSTGFYHIGPDGKPIIPSPSAPTPGPGAAPPSPGAPAAAPAGAAPTGTAPTVTKPGVAVPKVVQAAQAQVAARGQAPAKAPEVEVAGDPLVTDKNVRRRLGEGGALMTHVRSMDQFVDEVDARTAGKPVPASIMREIQAQTTPQAREAAYHRLVIVPARSEALAAMDKELASVHAQLITYADSMSQVASAKQTLNQLVANFTKPNGQVDYVAINKLLQGDFPAFKAAFPDFYSRLRNIDRELSAQSAGDEERAFNAYRNKVRGQMSMTVLAAKKAMFGQTQNKSETAGGEAGGLGLDMSYDSIKTALDETSKGLQAKFKSSLPDNPFQASYLLAKIGRDHPGLVISGKPTKKDE